MPGKKNPALLAGIKSISNREDNEYGRETA
jgi:hypothetical protein